MDSQRRKVRRIMSTGACFPMGLPTGSFFDFDEASLYSDQNKDISIRFRCMGAEYNDDILIKEFNETSAIFNPVIREYMKADYRLIPKKYKIIDPSVAQYTNYMGYPVINPYTYDLLWIVSDSQEIVAQDISTNTRAKTNYQAGGTAI
jgi:hypothetical protein